MIAPEDRRVSALGLLALCLLCGPAAGADNGTRTMGGKAAMGVVVGRNASAAPGAWYSYSERYERWQADRPLTIAAWHNRIPTDHMADRIARMQAAGINLFYGGGLQDGRHFYRAAHKAALAWGGGMSGKSLRYFDGGDWRAEYAVRREGIRRTLAIGGAALVSVMDEPTVRGMSEQQAREVYEQIRQRIAWVKGNYPDLLAYANLSIGNVDVDRYIKTCEPDVFSFDEYPLLLDGTDHPAYGEKLLRGRQFARRFRLPYWMILQAFGRKMPGREPWRSYRVPDEADMRYLVFSFLAHGGSGLTLYIYYGYGYDPPVTIRNMVDDVRVRHPGKEPPANHRYEHTIKRRSWFAIRDLAPEVRTLARALLNLRTKDPLGYAGAAPAGCPAFEGHGALRSVSCRDDAAEPVLVSFFDDEAGEEYFFVVNLVHGPNMSKMDCRKTLRLVFDRTVERIERLNRLTGRVEALRTRAEGGSRVLDIHLEGGTGDLFKWATGKPWALRSPRGMRDEIPADTARHGARSSVRHIRITERKTR